MMGQVELARRLRLAAGAPANPREVPMMLRTKTLGSLVVAATVLLTPLGWPASADARPRHGGGYVGVGGFYGWGPYWGWGAPYWGWGAGPYGSRAGNGLLGYAMISGMGGLDVDAKPDRAEVWVDGRFVADARDLDGDPSYLWLKQGAHHVVLYKAGFKSFEDDVDVRAGVLRRLKVQLEKGESRPPVAAPAEVRREPARPELGAARPRTGGAGGVVRLQVRPRDASVYVDGGYRGTAGELPSLRLSAGHHRLELVRPGFQPLEKELDVEADQSFDLELSMERGGAL
jgi:hypothetical protein